ncbi:hypothetical protein RINTHM_580 [Richelia intracellularis HM01]|nr:hypothetical protein RINTHM_580 [Richelia intracellularis HM01]
MKAPPHDYHLPRLFSGRFTSINSYDNTIFIIITINTGM